ncbi:survival motor neuron protein-like isoform X1 [Tachypleus tridentatus]|uniref:survival motor neuron protein-like isoform X1 n=1 Tax=Tachypleus tridentatus TaxID=6853 RepID=UPI003FD271CC
MATEGGGILWKRDNDQWKLGDYCQAIFSEDGLLYEACVMSTNEQEGTCVVHFLGYGNEEEVRIGDLLASQGKHARAQQELAAQGYFADNIDVEGSNPAWQYANQLHGPSTSFIPDIPPLPPFPLDDEGVTDDEAQASMLMSWYMSGYHTGYYQALRQMRTESCECQEHDNNKCCLRCSS